MDQTIDKTFDPLALADDLDEVQRIYTRFFDERTDADWDRPVKGTPQEWNLRETVAHLCALNGAGLESIQALLRGETYVFEGLADRYQFHAYNLRGIESQRRLPASELRARLLEILGQAAEIARGLRPEQIELASVMPIYNRPVRITEGLGIILFHTGLNHSAQVAEPAGVPPLWTHLSPEIRQRLIGRVMRALSLLYRPDLGGDMRAVLAFQVDGQGGGNWHVQVSPQACTSGSGPAGRPNLTVHLRNTDVFCRMFSGRIKPLLALLSGQLKLHGDLRLFLRMGSLFSVDAR